MPRTRRLILTATLVLAGGLAAAGPAPAAFDGTSNTIMTAHSCALSFTAIEFKNTGFMDYTDDACLAFARGGQRGAE